MLGVITANIADAGDICDTLSRQGVDHIVMGSQKSAYVTHLLGGRFIGVDLRGLGEGRISARRLIPRLRERSVTHVVNAGTLTGLLDTAIHLRAARGGRHLEADIEAQKLAALKLERVLTAGGIEVAWLAETAQGFQAGAGVLNGVEPTLPQHDLRAAVRRARKASIVSPVACAWIDDGPGRGMVTFDTDEKLKILAVQPPPAHPRLLVKLAAHPEHSPLDPPMVGPPTIRWAIAAHVSAILIDAKRGVIVSREQTLGCGADAGIAVVGV